jgi:hypothetical protein
MLKIKPLLLFIIFSIALHWWVLSLPIFQRIKLLENTGATNNTPTIIAKLSNSQTPLEQQKMNEKNTSNKENIATASQQQSLPPPSFLRGSPWLRRSAESLSGNPSASMPPSTTLSQLELKLPIEAAPDQNTSFECKRIGLARVFFCQSPNNEALAEKISRLLNQLTDSYILQLPNCIILDTQEKKWHAKACHS